MFGCKRFGKDLEAICRMENPSDETIARAVMTAVFRVAKTNFAVGAISAATAGGIVGLLGAEYIKNRKGKKKVEELKETDK